MLALKRALEGEPSFTIICGASSVGKVQSSLILRVSSPIFKTYIQTSLLREVLSREEYHVLHFDLGIARFAGLARLYLRLMEQYLEEISKKVKRSKIKRFTSDKSVKRRRSIFRESVLPHNSLRPSTLSSCHCHITFIAHSALVYILPEGSGIRESPFCQSLGVGAIMSAINVRRQIPYSAGLSLRANT